MVGPSKILTVSYGTFSCTLEGFEDSFSTMKAIAEYFRDLAADDRYFGAEPASPDAEMLARIAEREIARRVEARTSSSGIVLRAAAALSAPEAGPADAAETETEAAPPAAAAPAPRPAEPAWHAPLPMPPAPKAAAAAPAWPSPTPADGDSVAAKLQRIRAVVGRSPSRALIETNEEDQALPSAVPDEHWLNPDAPATSAPLPDEAGISEQAAADVEPSPIDLPQAEPRPEPLAPEPEPEPAGLAPLMLMTVADAVDEPEAPADDALYLDGGVEAPEGAADAGEPQLSDAEAAEQPDEAWQDEAWNGALERFTAELGGADEAEVMSAATLDLGTYLATADAADHGETEEDDTEDLVATLMMRAEADSIDSSSDAEPEAVAEAEPEAEPAGIAEPGYLGTVAMDDLVSEERGALVEERPPLRTRLIRISRSVAEPAEDATELALNGTLEEAAEIALDSIVEDAAPLAPSDAVDGSVSPDEEAALMAELAALDAEPEADELEGAGDEDEDHEDAAAYWDQAVMADQIGWSEPDAAPADQGTDAGPAPADQATNPEESAGVDAPRRAGHGFVEPEPDEASLTRLLSRAEGEFAAPEAQTRREALTGLKAAVAAAEAARQLGEGRGAADEAAFRNDLRHVVRPRRPEPAGEKRSERPRPAPLKLVAAQRIDLVDDEGSPRAGGPVQPRRVRLDDVGTAAAAPAFGPSFAGFAREVGARDLPDLLEAAAAYAAFVEGVEDFSRPQLVSKVREMASEVFSREDELRSFGTLLRQGRIAKVRNGRFQVTEATRFQPESRAV